MRVFLIILMTMLVFPLSVNANEEDLYAPVPPADSSFVRTIGIISVDGNDLPKSAQADVSDYSVLKNGDYKLEAGDVSKDMTVAAGQYYTIGLLPNATIKVFKDALIENPSKAMIYFYNLSEAKIASLEAFEHKAKIFEDITTGESDSREINAVTFGLEVKVDGKKIAILDDVELKRQVGTTVVLTGSNGNYSAFVLTNKVAQ